MIENCPMRHENGNCIPAGGFCTANKNICEALLNAYKMGKAQLSKEDTTSDLISRQQAIDEIKNYCENGCDIAEDNWCPSCQREQFIKLLKALPTVPPERTEERTEMHACDLIDRQAAIDAFEDTTFTKNEIRRRLLEVPSAQPESEHTMEEFMYGQDLGSPEDGSL